ncbi:hypothetical protein D3C80_17450 [compost metagenome]
MPWVELAASGAARNGLDGAFCHFERNVVDDDLEGAIFQASRFQDISQVVGGDGLVVRVDQRVHGVGLGIQGGHQIAFSDLGFQGDDGSLSAGSINAYDDDWLFLSGHNESLSLVR